MRLDNTANLLRLVQALEVVEHVEIVIAIEMLAACQALEFHRCLVLPVVSCLEAANSCLFTVYNPAGPSKLRQLSRRSTDWFEVR